MAGFGVLKVRSKKKCLFEDPSTSASTSMANSEMYE
jgi:hypothetical protein